MTIHKALHPRDDMDEGYMQRKGGGRGLTSIEDCIDTTIQGFEEKTKKGQRKTNYSSQQWQCNI